MSTITAFSMFFLSFSPLWVSVIFLDVKSIYDKTPYLYTEMISIVLILVTSFISTIVLLWVFRSRNCDRIQKYALISAEEEKTITSEFLLSYILPLFAFDFTVWHEVILFLVFFVVLSYLCIRHNHFSVNIILELMGYRFYSCEMTNEDNSPINKIVITQSELSADVGKDILIHPINNEYLIQITNCD